MKDAGDVARHGWRGVSGVGIIGGIGAGAGIGAAISSLIDIIGEKHAVDGGDPARAEIDGMSEGHVGADSGIGIACDLHVGNLGRTHLRGGSEGDEELV